MKKIISVMVVLVMGFSFFAPKVLAQDKTYGGLSVFYANSFPVNHASWGCYLFNTHWYAAIIGGDFVFRHRQNKGSSFSVAITAGKYLKFNNLLRSYVGAELGYGFVTINEAEKSQDLKFNSFVTIAVPVGIEIGKGRFRWRIESGYKARMVKKSLGTQFFYLGTGFIFGFHV